MSDFSATPDELPVPNDVEPIGPIRSSWGQLRISVWQLWYWIKKRYLGGWIAGLLFLFSLVELTSPLVHEWLGSTLHWTLGYLFPRKNYHFWKTSGFHHLLVVTLVISALIMFLDHHRLKTADQLHRRFSAYLKWLVENSWVSSDISLQDRLIEVLTGLVDALDASPKRWKRRQSRVPLNATLLCTLGPGDDRLVILAQDARDVFETHKIMLHSESVAGTIARRKNIGSNSGFLIYVPWTKYAHGLSFEYSLDQKGRSSQKGDSIEVIKPLPEVYSQIDEPGQKQLGSLLCIGVDCPAASKLEHPKFGTICNPKFVLSISSYRCDRLGSQVFDAARLVSKFLPRVFE